MTMRTVVIAVLLLLAVVASAQTSYFGPMDLGGITDKRLNEISGIAASRQLPNHYWVINDSGDDPNVYCVGPDGATVTTVRLIGDTNRDWEDIALGPGPHGGKSYLYVAEIGDNNARAKSIRIHRIEEPYLVDVPDTVDLPRSKRDVIECVYPKGARDAEALFVDPRTKDIYIITKREPHVGVYRLPWPQSTERPSTLELVGTLPYGMVTSAAISLDGARIAVKTYSQVLVYTRGANQTVMEALRTQPDTAAYMVEPQGEAVTWMPDGQGYVTVSEKSYAKILPRLFGYVLTGAQIPSLPVDREMPLLQLIEVSADSLSFLYSPVEATTSLRAYVTNALQTTVVQIPITDGSQGTHEASFSMYALPPGSYLLNLEIGGRYVSAHFTRR